MPSPRVHCPTCRQVVDPKNVMYTTSSCNTDENQIADMNNEMNSVDGVDSHDNNIEIPLVGEVDLSTKVAIEYVTE
jgi:hypothetical protein